jgi:hypothetical protein
MSEKVILSLDTLPVEILYRILDNLDHVTILCSMETVCKRINAVIASYYPYQVSFDDIKEDYIGSILSISYHLI